MSPPIIAAVLGVVLTALITLNAWSVKTLIEVKAAVAGSPGNKGLSGDVEALKSRAYGWDKQLGDHETRITVLQYQHEEGA